MKKKPYQLSDAELCEVSEHHCRIYRNCSDATRLLAEMTDRYTKALNIIDDLTKADPLGVEA